MAGGLVALLDDVAALVKLAAASVDDVGAAAARASVKATGVVVDDTAVTPRYVQGLEPERELPIIKRIALGSLRNKLLIILPVIMLLSQFLPWLLTPILMVGGAYLAYEGAEKVWEIVSGHHEEEAEAGEVDEDAVVSGAIRTDFILSAEIMVIALNEVDTEPFLSRLIILVIVALLITALVYGVVGLIVKMDDVGLHLAAARVGRRAARRPRPRQGHAASCSRSSRPSASPRCCGSVATSCSSASTSSAGTPSTTSSTTSRRAWPGSPASVACSPGSSTRSPRRSSASSSARSSSPSLHVLPRREEGRGRPLRAHTPGIVRGAAARFEADDTPYAVCRQPRAVPLAPGESTAGRPHLARAEVSSTGQPRGRVRRQERAGSPRGPRAVLPR